MKNNRRRAIAGTTIFGATILLSVLGGAPANAATGDCSHWKSDGRAYALCESGSGAYRAVGACRSWADTVTYIYGPWKTIGYISATGTCPSGYYMDYTGVMSA